MRELFESFRPDAVMHLAAESHVDRSIDGPGDFIQTNVVGTFTLLQAARGYWRALPASAAGATSASTTSRPTRCSARSAMTASSPRRPPYDPRSPYSASKAASDHLVRAWHHTYGLPVLVTNCSNNYGPYQFPEKLIPLMIINALEGQPLPVYGNGRERARLAVRRGSRARAARRGHAAGEPGETYSIGGRQRARPTSTWCEAICALLDELAPRATIGPRKALITLRRRPARARPALRHRSPARSQRELGWQPRETFESGLRKTVEWYLANRAWWERIRSGVYRGERLGVVA